jgi:diketogulonate reductase-like aldo/keto reductase
MRCAKPSRRERCNGTTSSSPPSCGIPTIAQSGSNPPSRRAHPYLPEWELLDYCREQEIVLLAFAALGHSLDPNVLADPVITAIASRENLTPAQVCLSWAVQRGSAFLTTSTKPHRIEENYQIAPLPADAMQEIRDHITASVRFNSVVGSGVPGFIPSVPKPDQT